jgi:hypothetical protein
MSIAISNQSNWLIFIVILMTALLSHILRGGSTHPRDEISLKWDQCCRSVVLYIILCTFS